MDKRDGERGEGIDDHSLPGALRGRREPPIFYKRHVDTDVTALNREEWLGQSLLADFTYQPASLYANQLRGRKGTPMERPRLRPFSGRPRSGPAALLKAQHDLLDT